MGRRRAALKPDQSACLNPACRGATARDARGDCLCARHPTRHCPWLRARLCQPPVFPANLLARMPVSPLAKCRPAGGLGLVVGLRGGLRQFRLDQAAAVPGRHRAYRPSVAHRPDAPKQVRLHGADRLWSPRHARAKPPAHGQRTASATARAGWRYPSRWPVWSGFRLCRAGWLSGAGRRGRGSVRRRPAQSGRCQTSPVRTGQETAPIGRSKRMARFPQARRLRLGPPHKTPYRPARGPSGRPNRADSVRPLSGSTRLAYPECPAISQHGPMPTSLPDQRRRIRMCHQCRDATAAAAAAGPSTPLLRDRAHCPRGRVSTALSSQADQRPRWPAQSAHGPMAIAVPSGQHLVHHAGNAGA